MYKKIPLLTFLLVCNLFFAQFATVVDKDGYVNLRATEKTNSKIIGRVPAGAIVYITGQGTENAGSDMAYVSYNTASGPIFNESVEGYIHRSRLVEINSFQQIPTAYDEKSGAVFQCCKVFAELKTEQFDFRKYKNLFEKNSSYYTYNGKYALGADESFLPASRYV